MTASGFIEDILLALGYMADPRLLIGYLDECQ